MAQGRVPFDAKAAADNAAVADSMAKLPWAAFGEGTDKGETQAKPEVWKDSAKFKEYADKLQTEMGKVVAASKTGSMTVQEQARRHRARCSKVSGTVHTMQATKYRARNAGA